MFERLVEVSGRFSFYWNHRDLLAEGIYDQQPRVILRRFLVSLLQVVEEEEVRLELLVGLVADPGVELARALLDIVVLDAPLLDVGYLYGPIVQPSSLVS